MRINFKYFRDSILVFFMTLVMFFGIDSVSAVTISGGNYINFNDYGLKVTNGTHYKTSYKTSSGKEAYCIQFTKSFRDGNYTEDNCKTNKITDKVKANDYLIAANIVNFIDSKNWDKNKKYAYKVAALNTYFSSKVSGASTFNQKSSSEAKDIVNSIIRKSSNLSGEDCKCSDGVCSCGIEGVSATAPDAKVSSNPLTITEGDSSNTAGKVISSSTMGIVGTTRHKFISKKITFSGLYKEFNGVKPTYKFTISGAKSGVNYYLCTTTNWTSCKPYNEISVSGKESVSYYVRAQTDRDADVPVHNFGVNIKTTFANKYSTAKIYCKGTSNQAVLMLDSSSKNTTLSKKVTFKIPSDKPEIEILKIDDDGESLSGADFKLYSVDSSGKKTEISLEKNSDSFKHIFADNTSIAGKYYLEETKAPNGFLVSSGQEFEVSGTSSSTCYDADGNKTSDDKFCDSSIKKVCKVTTTTTAEDGTSSSNSIYNDDEVCVSQPETEPNVTKATVCAKEDNGKYTEVDTKYCDNKDNYTKVTIDGKSVLISKVNTKNRVVISKRAVGGKDELSGASLKICTETDYKSSGNNCTIAKSVSGVTLSWVSGIAPVEFNGINPGTYYVVEISSPSGYKNLSKAVEFKIDSNGTITTGGSAVSDDTIVVENEISDATVSKVDMATSKELPGANLSICTTVTSNVDDTEGATTGENNSSTSDNGYTLELDSDGNCIPATLSDGTSATWTSSDKPHSISGLPAGVYYLVETTAPNGYATAESILFKMNEDGKLTDIYGKSLADNKLVMKDKPIEDVKTGKKIAFIAVLMGVIAAGMGAYYYSKANGGLAFAGISKISGKIRKRKIHK